MTILILQEFLTFSLNCILQHVSGFDREHLTYRQNFLYGFLSTIQLWHLASISLTKPTNCFLYLCNMLSCVGLQEHTIWVFGSLLSKLILTIWLVVLQ